ncbi:MAG TPA: hypothetical protein VFF68_12690, partial [Anaerolineaceae bacterium]|nr:hypothetical protein [Anaerolineaceae bacterium]
MRKIQLAVLFAAFVAAIVLPYVVAANAAGDEYWFGGFLLNPIDGNTYLAKMQQGFSGSWTFTLPFTAEPGEGVYLFLFYLFLGHLARLTGLDLLGLFHLARVAAAVFMLWEAILLARAVLPTERLVRFAAVLMAFGSGAGWLFVLAGSLTSDFWVAEAYPFLSAYANPHFPLGLGLMFWILRQAITPAGRWLPVRLAMSGVLLSLALPFGVVIVGVVVFAMTVWAALQERQVRWRPVWIAAAAGVPYVVYSYLVTLSHPVLAGWNAQNLTPAPPIWDTIVSFSPALLLAAAGLRQAWTDRSQPAARLLILWLGLTLLLVTIPTNLQRRFLLGLYVPAALLAVLGIDWLARHSPLKLQTWFALALIISLPTNLLVVAGGLAAAGSHSTDLYATGAERAALAWIAEKT